MKTNMAMLPCGGSRRRCMIESKSGLGNVLFQVKAVYSHCKDNGMSLRIRASGDAWQA